MDLGVVVVTRRLKIAEQSAPNVAGDVLRALAIALAPYMREYLAVQQQDQELVDVLDMLPPSERKPGGDGRHRVGIARAALTACRSGAIVNASKVGRRWLAPRTAVLDWLRAQGPRPLPAPIDKREVDEFDDLRASLARPATRSRR